MDRTEGGGQQVMVARVSGELAGFGVRWDPGWARRAVLRVQPLVGFKVRCSMAFGRTRVAPVRDRRVLENTVRTWRETPEPFGWAASRSDESVSCFGTLGTL